MTQDGSTAEAARQVVEDLALFDDWTERYEYIVELGERLPPIPEILRTDQYRVTGCQSRVWLAADYRDGLVHFVGDSDAAVVKGLLALLVRVYSGRTPGEIAATPADFVGAADLGAHLTGNRASGLSAMVKRIKTLAARADAAAAGQRD